jgi:hypothetical protein
MKELAEALRRAMVLMKATQEYMDQNPIAAEYTVLYDEATCDGSCLAEDCRIALMEAENALRRTESVAPEMLGRLKTAVEFARNVRYGNIDSGKPTVAWLRDMDIFIARAEGRQ